MLNKLALASAMFCGLAAAAKDRYVGSCKATDLDGNPRGWAKFRQEPDSDEVVRQFVLEGFHAGETVTVHLYQTKTGGKQTWTIQADDNGAVVINEKDDSITQLTDLDQAVLLLDTWLDSLDCFIHVKKDDREARRKRRDGVIEPDDEN